MGRVLSLLLLGGLLVAVRGLSLKDLFKQRQQKIQSNAGGVQETTAQETNSNFVIFKPAPPAPPPPPPAPPIQDVEELWCAPEWTKVASRVCIKIFEDERVTLEEAKGKCKQLPEYKGESASLLEVSAGNPNAPENQYIKNSGNGGGKLWISTQHDKVDYVINKSTGQAVTEIASKTHGYVCGAEPGKGRRIRKK